MDEHIGLGVLGRRSAYCGTLLLPQLSFFIILYDGATRVARSLSGARLRRSVFGVLAAEPAEALPVKNALFEARIAAVH
jgi:hypothetical protein